MLHTKQQYQWNNIDSMVILRVNDRLLRWFFFCFFFVLVLARISSRWKLFLSSLLNKLLVIYFRSLSACLFPYFLIIFNNSTHKNTQNTHQYTWYNVTTTTTKNKNKNSEKPIVVFKRVFFKYIFRFLLQKIK